jgi:hypothetical protein
VAHTPFEYGGGYCSGHVLLTWTNTARPAFGFKKFEYFGDCHFQLQGVYTSKKCSSNTSIGALYLSELALTRTLHHSTNLHLNRKPNPHPHPSPNPPHSNPHSLDLRGRFLISGCPKCFTKVKKPKPPGWSRFELTPLAITNTTT